MPRPCCSLPLALLLPCATAGAAWAQDTGPRRHTIQRTGVAPIIDGRLSDEVWQNAPVLGDFTQVDPDLGAPATQPTEVRGLFDDEHLYLAIRCHDDEPGRIRATEMKRDGSTGSDDFVSIAIDPYSSQRSGYLFTLGPAGLRGDALIEGNSIRTAWDAIWYSAVTIDDEGWVAEVSIPFKSLSFDPNRTEWLLNIERTVRRTNEVTRWSGARRELGVEDLGGAGIIDGFSGNMHQGYGLTIKPFGVLTSELDDGWPDFDAGLDVFYRITPEITAAITVNTDFAEAEVDQRRVNLSRFPLFFEEKRDFFLEEAGVFEFGGIRQSPRPFFSRRIGIVNGEEKGILAGARVTGRTGNVRFGVMNVQMEDDDDLGSKNLSVARAIVDVLDESYLGVIATNGNPSARGENQLFGADFGYVNTSFMGDANLRAGVFAQATRDDPDAGEEQYGYAVGGRAQITTEDWSVFGFVSQVDERYRPALGFVSRPGEREHIARVTRTFRPEWEGVRAVDVSTGGEFFTDLKDTVNTLEVTLIGAALETDTGDFVAADFMLERDVLREPFEISDGVVLDEDSYHWLYVTLNAGTDSSQPLAGELSLRFGEFYDGTRSDYSAIVSARPNAMFQGSVEGVYQDINLPEGDFEVEILRARGAIQFSPDLTFDTIVQWDSVSDITGLNARLRWEPRPGQEIYIVYNESYDTDDNFSSTEREAILKFGATIRF
ncbi:MAG: carbohydrate binding family 9 domain-containing protein [Phycisphaerales bacterium]|nr:carbohydrate binding family 9 domain-containing protein [Phycisphaerales bacterium]MCB9837334.1 carbohydrate binding family 9 domain-containing protein [Phycisphaera sp.]